MAEAQSIPTETTELRFETFHHSAGNAHLRTDGPLLFIDKDNEQLLETAKKLYRGQRIRVTGGLTFSTTLSNYVFAVVSLEPL